MLNEYLTNILAEPFYPAGAGRLIWRDGDYADSIREDFAVLKRGPWIAAMSNFQSRPRPEGHFTLDYQNLFSLYHRGFGVVLKGSNSKNDPELSTFNKSYTSFDGDPLAEPLWQYIPGCGRFQVGDTGCSLLRHYRGFEGHLDFQITGPDTAVLNITVDARASVYPVTCSLQPACGFGRGFTDGHGRKIELGETPFRASGKDLGGVMVLTPEPSPDVAAGATGKPVKLLIPDDAEVVWPFKDWDCYNLKTDRHNAQGSTLLLKVPVSPSGAQVVIRTAI